MRGQASPAGNEPGMTWQCMSTSMSLVRSVAQQNAQNLRQGPFGTCADAFRTGAGKWMLHEDVLVICKAAAAGHAFSGAREWLGTQDGGRNTELFEFRGVVQTAPRTRPSIAYGVDHQI